VVDVNGDGKIRLSKKVLEEGGPEGEERHSQSSHSRRPRRH
jgi:hypothetical protein